MNASTYWIAGNWGYLPCFQSSIVAVFYQLSFLIIFLMLLRNRGFRQFLQQLQDRITTDDARKAAQASNLYVDALLLWYYLCNKVHIFYTSTVFAAYICYTTQQVTRYFTEIYNIHYMMLQLLIPVQLRLLNWKDHPSSLAQRFSDEPFVE